MDHHALYAALDQAVTTQFDQFVASGRLPYDAARTAYAQFQNTKERHFANLLNGYSKDPGAGVHAMAAMIASESARSVPPPDIAAQQRQLQQPLFPQQYQPQYPQQRYPQQYTPSFAAPPSGAAYGRPATTPYGSVLPTTPAGNMFNQTVNTYPSVKQTQPIVQQSVAPMATMTPMIPDATPLTLGATVDKDVYKPETTEQYNDTYKTDAYSLVVTSGSDPKTGESTVYVIADVSPTPVSTPEQAVAIVRDILRQRGVTATYTHADITYTRKCAIEGVEAAEFKKVVLEMKTVLTKAQAGKQGYDRTLKELISTLDNTKRGIGDAVDRLLVRSFNDAAQAGALCPGNSTEQPEFESLAAIRKALVNTKNANTVTSGSYTAFTNTIASCIYGTITNILIDTDELVETAPAAKKKAAAKIVSRLADDTLDDAGTEYLMANQTVTYTNLEISELVTQNNKTFVRVAVVRYGGMVDAKTPEPATCAEEYYIITHTMATGKPTTICCQALPAIMVTYTAVLTTDHEVRLTPVS